MELRIYGVSFAGICFAGTTETRNHGHTEGRNLAALQRKYESMEKRNHGLDPFLNKGLKFL